jgi:hypothetical protein
MWQWRRGLLAGEGGNYSGLPIKLPHIAFTYFGVGGSAERKPFAQLVLETLPTLFTTWSADILRLSGVYAVNSSLNQRILGCVCLGTLDYCQNVTAPYVTREQSQNLYLHALSRNTHPPNASQGQPALSTSTLHVKSSHAPHLFERRQK